MTRDDVVRIVAQALGVDAAGVNLETSAETNEFWDSLVHVNILTALDTELDGKAAEIEEIMEATSVQKICDTLNRHGLLA